MKNPTPRQLAVYAASLIALASAAALLLLKAFSLAHLDWWLALITPLFIFMVAYYAITLVLERYIYRKIKLIYKTIRRSKMKQEDKNTKLDLSSHIIDEVEKEVGDWAALQNKEIDELKRLEEYRRDFLGDISHELKTPIFNIQGYLHTLLDGGLDDEAINLPYIKKAAKNVERLHSIVQDLESISTMESGAVELDLETFNIKEVAERVFEEQFIKAKERGITLKFKSGADKGFDVMADREKISQVLTNLVSNSIKYGREGGRTQVSFYDMDKLVLVEVADDGLGIEQKHLTRLFDRFYRVDKSRSRHAGGTGLGLAIVKHILEIHQQSINVRSTVGRGTTFGFTLLKV